jgi:hypothetical protein
VNVTRRKVGEIFLNGSEWPGTFARRKRVGIANGFFNGVRVKSPQFQRVIHSARDNPTTLQIEIGAENFVPMALDTAKNCDTLIGSYVPEPKGVILGNGQKEIGIGRVKL